ncbi:MAG TPA: Dabb family protein [Chloroflexota bacterium]|nr:Dabb family protein [Chloroflexota bacterium]
MIRHVIVFNAEAPYAEVLAMAEQARTVLGAIEGVTEVRFGVAVAESARYRYFFDIGFVDEATIDYYMNHPAHVAFATQVFRPMAPDRITTDYRVEV